MATKPNLAEDWNENKVRFPVFAQPKIDGVRGLHLDNGLTGRSLKKHRNKFTTSLFSHPMFAGFDGEMAAEKETHPDLCRITSSAVSSIDGEPYVLWHVFDYVTPTTVEWPYRARYEAMCNRIGEIQLLTEHPMRGRVVAMPSYLVHNMEQLIELDTWFLEQGYEGTILRDPEGVYKQGRSTVNEGGLLRIKRFVEDEAVIVEIVEGQVNTNEAQLNERGLQYRTSHAEGMIPNGMVGTLIGVDCKTGNRINVAPGKMTDNEAKYYFANPSEIIGKIMKYKHFPKGVKDKPRFPTFQSFRVESDI